MSLSTLKPEDFKQLPEDGARFEALVCQLLEAMGYRILEKPAVGSEGGRDVLVERTLKDEMGGRRERVVVQCKHHAHSGKAVGDNAVGVWENAMKRHKARGYLLVTDVRVTENLSSSFREFTNDEVNFPNWATSWDVDELITHLNEHSKVRNNFFNLQIAISPLRELADEVRTWLLAVRYEVSDLVPSDEKAIDFIATFKQGTIKQRVLVRCIGGEITPNEIDELRASLNLETSQGWIISDQRVSERARNRAEADSTIRVFNLSELLQEMIWGGYFDFLSLAVNGSNILKLYIEPSCYKQGFDNDLSENVREQHLGLEKYMDKWLAERGKVHISLLGEFGSGKTWFCYHYAYTRLKHYLENPAKERLPLLITLRSFTKAMTAQQLINDALLEQYRLPLVGSAYEVFQELNRRGKILLILDGFDEMARQVDYQTVVDNFWELANLVDDNSKVILTSRTEYFRAASESEKVLGGEEFGRKTKELKPPKFDVLYLEPFTDEQIRQVIINRLGVEEGEEVAARILRDTNLAAMARKPVLIELLLAALDEVSADVLENPAHVYLYATNKLLLRNITAEKTFTSMADKLFFLCELAWEMIASNELRIHYTDIPTRIKHYFGEQIQDQHVLDTWDFDLRNQTLLHRDAAGYYEFAHKSLAEYFVAFKFAAELGNLSPEFQQAYCEVTNLPCTLPFITKEVGDLAKSFGAISLRDKSMQAVLSLLLGMLNEEVTNHLWNIVDKTRGGTISEIKFVGGNALTLLNLLGESLSRKDLSQTILTGGDFRGNNLRETNLQGAVLTDANMANCILCDCLISGADLERADLRHSNLEGADLGGCNLRNVRLQNSLINRANLKGSDLSGISISDLDAEDFEWSRDNSRLVIGTSDGSVLIWDSLTGEQVNILKWNGVSVHILVWNESLNRIATYDDNQRLRIWKATTNEVMTVPIMKPMTNRMFFSESGKYLSTCHAGSGEVTIWDAGKAVELASFVAQPGWCNAAAFLGDEDTILTTGYGGQFKTWNWKEQKLITSISIQGSGNIHSVRVSENKKRIMAIVTYPHDIQNPGHADKYKLFVWSLPEFTVLLEHDFEEKPNEGKGLLIHNFNAHMSADGRIVTAIINRTFMAEDESETNRREGDVYVLDVDLQSVRKVEHPETLRLLNNRVFICKLNKDGKFLSIINSGLLLLLVSDVNSADFGKVVKQFRVKLDCSGLQLSDDQGLQQLVTGKATLKDFFSERGAIIE